MNYNYEDIGNKLGYNFPIILDYITYEEHNNVLQYIGCGVPNAVYYDKRHNTVVKMAKSEKVKKNAITANNGYIEFDISQAEEDLSKKNELIKLLSSCSSFLQPKGIIFYPNLFTKKYAKDSINAAYIPVCIMYEYLDDLKEWNIIDDMTDENIIQGFYNIVEDCHYINVNGYSHGDLDLNHHNIISYINEDCVIRKLKVIDVDSVSKIFTFDNVIINNLIEEKPKHLSDIIDLVYYADSWNLFVEDTNVSDVIRELKHLSYISIIDIVRNISSERIKIQQLCKITEDNPSGVEYIRYEGSIDEVVDYINSYENTYGHQKIWYALPKNCIYYSTLYGDLYGYFKSIVNTRNKECNII